MSRSPSSATRRSRKSRTSGKLWPVSMCMTGNGKRAGRKAFSASRSSTMESLPPENSRTGRSNSAATSRMMKTDSASSASRWEKTGLDGPCGDVGGVDHAHPVGISRSATGRRPGVWARKVGVPRSISAHTDPPSRARPGSRPAEDRCATPRVLPSARLPAAARCRVTPTRARSWPAEPVRRARPSRLPGDPGDARGVPAGHPRHARRGAGGRAEHDRARRRSSRWRPACRRPPSVSMAACSCPGCCCWASTRASRPPRRCSCRSWSSPSAPARTTGWATSPGPSPCRSSSAGSSARSLGPFFARSLPKDVIARLVVGAHRGRRVSWCWPRCAGAAWAASGRPVTCPRRGSAASGWWPGSRRASRVPAGGRSASSCSSCRAWSRGWPSARRSSGACSWPRPRSSGYLLSATAFEDVRPDYWLLVPLFAGSVAAMVPGAAVLSRLGRERATIAITLLSISLALPTLIWG